jgi:hypothetical protein
VGLLAALSGLAPAGARVEPRQLVAGFRIEAIPRGPAVLAPADVEALAGR